MKKLLIIFFLLSFSGSLNAQSFSMGADIYKPTQEFGQALDAIPAGINLQLMLPVWLNQKLQAGVDFGFANYSCRSYEYEFEAGEPIELMEDDGFFRLHFVLRYDLWNDRTIIPFVELRSGFSSFYTHRYDANEACDDYESPYESEKVWHGKAQNNGFGAGFKVNFMRLIYGSEAPQLIVFTTSVNVLQGTAADYRATNPTDIFTDLRQDVSRTATSSMMFNVGMQFNFGEMLKDCNIIR